MLITAIINPRFLLGGVVATPTVIKTIPMPLLAVGLNRHARADWGNVCTEDARSNNEALDHGGRLLSAYGEGPLRFWIITEADRSVTTLLLPEDY